VTLTAQNGIVDVVGNGDYGPVTIDHSLTIDGLGGIALLSGGTLFLDNVTAHGFAGSGVAPAPNANGVTLIRGGAPTGNCTGIAAGDGSLIQLTGSDVTSNATGFSAAGTDQIQGWPANTLSPNTIPGFTPGTLPLS
jgi:hypothetical protein